MALTPPHPYCLSGLPHTSWSPVHSLEKFSGLQILGTKPKAGKKGGQDSHIHVECQKSRSSSPIWLPKHWQTEPYCQEDRNPLLWDSDQTKTLSCRRELLKKETAIQITLKTTLSYKSKASNQLFSPVVNRKKTTKDCQMSRKSLKYRKRNTHRKEKFGQKGCCRKAISQEKNTNTIMSILSDNRTNP